MLELRYTTCLKKYLKIKCFSNFEEDFQILKIAIKDVYDYLCDQDFFYGTNRAGVFKSIYIEKIDLKLFQIADKYYMDQKTLYNHRLEYTRMIINQCLKLHKA